MVGWFLTTSEVKREAVRQVVCAGGVMALVMAAAFIMCVSAAAASEPIARLSSSDAGSAVRFVVQGDVRSMCQLPTMADLDLGNLEQARQTASFDFPIRCNHPFELEIRSDGALSHRTTPEGQGPFLGALTYGLEVSLPLRGPSTSRTALRSVSSAELRTGVSISTGQDISSNDGTLTLTLASPPPQGLLAGGYADTITMILKVGL